MTKPWPMVPLGDVLKKSEEWTNLKPEETYQEVTVRLWGKGVVLRREVTGAEIAASRRLVVRRQQFILSRIDARNGAFGLIPDSLDKAVVSNDFPVFNLNMQRVEPKFLEWISKTHYFVGICKAASEGTTNRVRLKEDRFLAAHIPLPPLPEQKRIVARIEELAANIEEAKGLRQKAVEEAAALSYSSLNKVFDELQNKYGNTQIGRFSTVKGGKRIPKGESLSNEPTPYPYIRVSDMKEHSVNLNDLRYVPNHVHSSIANYTINSNDVYVTIAGTIGYPGTIPYELEGANLTENAAKIVFDSPQDICKAFIVYALRSPQVQQQFNERRTVAAQPKLALHRIASTSISLPPFPEQRRIVAYLDDLQAKVDAVKDLQAGTAVELAAMLPSVLDRAFKGEL